LLELKKYRKNRTAAGQQCALLVRAILLTRRFRFPSVREDG
jgi:hypothetical protein